MKKGINCRCCRGFAEHVFCKDGSCLRYSDAFFKLIYRILGIIFDRAEGFRSKLEKRLSSKPYSFRRSN